MITLYDDGPTLFPDTSLGVSPFTRRVIGRSTKIQPDRLTLNYKKLPYKIIEINLDKIESTAKSIGAPPTRTNPKDGTPKYTIPIIQDSETGQVVSDSLRIIEYLDGTYPDTPKVMPPGTRILQNMFAETMFKSMLPMSPVMRPKLNEKFFTPEFIAGQRRVYGDEIMGSTLSPEEESAAWKTARASFDSLGEAYGKQTSPYIMGGDDPSVADFTVVGFLWFMNMTYGEESEEWKEVCSWSGGRIGVLCSEVVSRCGRKLL
ncbi:hypothetical protein E1B28_005369 [Marasmius oreades]|uniref:GST N-terminal domain-containing protein n=1 Tax=Marasmius oreades TaxID=181124 RepID=A0A9P7S319_9AGAR|nr:uncharacterized protein E1B28_005369 [Marasmius oreades]KAG7094541.1 hypothetical protein E1B28_005369 [Marasmius oreades]